MKNSSLGGVIVAVVGAVLFYAPTTHAEVPKGFYRSHSPQRELPKLSQRIHVGESPRFVDAAKGDDKADGSYSSPWKTLAHSLRQLKPGDTLYLRGGTYYEHVVLTQSGTAQKPITICSYHGEIARIDGGLREFAEKPDESWEAFAGGADGEYVSTRTYLEFDDRQAPTQFLPGSHEPMWGKEEERPLALGHFAESMVPLHGYRIAADLRSKNEFWLAGKNEMRDTGIYGGPGLWFNRETGRIHIRLAHHKLAGLGDRAYRGQTDPRELKLVVAAGFGNDVLRANGVKFVRLGNLVFQGATGSPMIHIYGCENIQLDHVTIYGGFPELLINASQNIRVTNSAFRGLAAPWTSRAHMKYRGTASYQIVLKNNQPLNENIEFSNCEFTDDHDFAFLRYVKGLQFHHNFVDNFNDDGLECGPKLRDHTLFISQNRIGRCLIPLSQHEIDKDESPIDHDAKTGVFAFRNVIDLRGGTYKSPPSQDDPTGEFLHTEGHLMGDHGSPIWPVLHFYQNTVLRDTPTFRDSFLFGLGSQGLRRTERDIFNNIFVQTKGAPGAGFIGMQHAENVREGGNLIWSVQDGPTLNRDLFAKFRASKLFDESRQHYEAGWTTNDRVADPKFMRFPAERPAKTDLNLSPDSPALASGEPVPTEWPDPLRNTAQPKPDIGALPAHAAPWGVGVDGRIPLMVGE